jgi:hypothetical protein
MQDVLKRENFLFITSAVLVAFTMRLQRPMDQQVVRCFNVHKLHLKRSY